MSTTAERTAEVDDAAGLEQNDRLFLEPGRVTMEACGIRFFRDFNEDGEDSVLFECPGGGEGVILRVVNNGLSPLHDRGPFRFCLILRVDNSAVAVKVATDFSAYWALRVEGIRFSPGFRARADALDADQARALFKTIARAAVAAIHGGFVPMQDGTSQRLDDLYEAAADGLEAVQRADTPHARHRAHLMRCSSPSDLVARVWHTLPAHIQTTISALVEEGR
jgi:hypothetical protein